LLSYGIRRGSEYVNLGIGIPTLVANHLPPRVNVTLHSENGLLGLGPFPFEGEEDPDLVNTSKQTVTLAPGGSYFDSAVSFAWCDAVTFIRRFSALFRSPSEETWRTGAFPESS
jgi:3-oxoacid CoA-transferase B subunit